MAIGSPRVHRAAASFWRECYREIRRHAGDPRLPYELRTRLRDAADRALRRSALEERRAIVPRWDRRMLSAAEPIPPSPDDVQRARRVVSDLGLNPDRPIVAIEVGNRADLLADASALLAAEGYQVARIGDAAAGPSLLRMSAFVVCRDAELQQAAYLTHTPSLRLDARDPFTAYPVRRDSLFALATPVDLDTGRPLAIPELLTERYFRNTRNVGYRATSASETAAAVAEMIDGVRNGWAESEDQARFRAVVADAGRTLGAHVRHIAEWDAASGFIGDGRLVRVQAARAL